MRPFEISLVILAVLAAVCLLVGRWQLTGRLFAACAAVAAVAHFMLEGAHWQMIPGYAAVVVLSLLACLSTTPKRLVRILAASFVFVLAAACSSFSFILPMFHLPKPTGPYPVGTATFYFKNSGQLDDAAPGGSAREVIVQLWYPAEPSKNPFARYREPRETWFINSYQSEVYTDSRLNAPIASAGSPFPVVLFNPGWHGRRTQNTFLTEDLASHGYVVAAIDHPYNAGIVAFPDGRIIHSTAAGDVGYPDGSTPARVRAVWDHELLKWVADERFVLDRLQAMDQEPGNPWRGKLNIQQAAAVGHSFGGAASTAVCAVDARIRAAVNLDGWFFSAIHMRGAGQPLLIMNSSPLDTNPGPNPDVGWLLDASDLLDTNTSLRNYGGYRVYVRGVEHEDFTDQALLSPLRSVNKRGILPAWKIQNIVRAYVLAFLDKSIRGADPSILHDQSRPFPEAVLEVWPEGREKGALAAISKAR